MMKLKKLLALTLAGTLLFAAGCTDSSATAEQASANTTTTTKEEPEKTEAETDAAMPAPTPVPDASSDTIGDGSGITLKLSFSGENFPKKPLYAELQDFFDETGVSTEVVYVPSEGGWAGYFSKLQTMIAANDSPDLINIAIEGFRIFQEADLILPIDSYLEKYPETKQNLDDLHPNIIAPYRVDGKLYGLTFEWNNVVTHINTNILADRGLEMPPADWNYDQFLDYARKMTYIDDKGQQVFGVVAPDANSYFMISALMFNNNASVLNDDWTKCTINSPDAIDIIQKLHDLVWVEKVAPQPPVETSTAFMNNQAAMHLAGRWPLKTYTESNFKDYDVQYLPTMKTNQVIFGGTLFPIMKSSDYPEESFLLTAKLCSAKAQRNILENTAIPSSISVMEEILVPGGLPANAVIFKDSADIAKAVESPSSYADIASTFARYMSEVYADEVSAEDAMNQCAAEIDGILQSQ